MYLKKLLILSTVLISSLPIYAEIVPYTEDPYSQQAPQEIVDLVQKAADVMGYKDKLEVIVPKKAGIEINPWNKFITYGKNPATQNYFRV